MGILEKLSNFFKGPNNTPEIQQDDSYTKLMLSTDITNLVYKIKRINTFDSSIWNLSNASTNELKGKSLVELENIKDRLNNRLIELMRESRRENPSREALEATKWTGQKPINLTNYEFDRFQRDDGR